MVNARFPEPTAYGFERVDAACVGLFAAGGAVNRKFTPNPIGRIIGKNSAV
jgi:hypothetical protein